MALALPTRRGGHGAAACLIAARPVRRGAALRRRHDHAGHLGASARRGPGGRDARASSPTSCRSRSRSWSACSSSSAAARRRVGALFGPVMLRLVRRASACSGVARIARDPQVLAAVDPRHAVRFFARQRLARLPRARRGRSWSSPAARRSTPTWATSARRPIRLAWFALVLPGAAAQLLRPGRAAARATRRRPSNPFYLLAPDWALYCRWSRSPPLATVIASQALISGAFSLTRQAVQLGYCPRMTIVHTSARRDRPDLRPGGQLAADGRRASASCSAFRLARATWPRPTASRSPDDGDHDRAVLRRGAPRAGAGAAAAAAASPWLVPRRSTSPSSARTSSRSRTAAGSRWSSAAVVFALHDHLEARPRGAGATRLRRVARMPLDQFLADIDDADARPRCRARRCS